MNTIQQMWEGYKKDVIPENASEIQITEMRNSFYAGSASSFELLGKISEKHSEETAAEILQGIHEEIALYFNP